MKRQKIKKKKPSSVQNKEESNVEIVLQKEKKNNRQKADQNQNGPIYSELPLQVDVDFMH